MKRVLWGSFGAIAIAAGCTGSDPDSASKPGDGDAGIEPINGEAKDYSFTISGPNAKTTLVQGGKATLTVVVSRKPDLDALNLPITVKVVEGPARVTGQTTIPGNATSAELELTASATADQGNAKLDLVASAGDKATALGSLEVFVRGTPGSLDTTFGTGGVVKSAVDVSMGRKVLVQPDGKILFLGVCYNSPQPACLTRLLPDGSLDTTFGSGGNTKLDGSSYTFQLQSDGKIVLFGRHPSISAILRVSRALADGSALDKSYGTQGIASTTLSQGTSLSVWTTGAVGPNDRTALGFLLQHTDNHTYAAFIQHDAQGAPLGVDPKGLSYVGWGGLSDPLSGLLYRSNGSVVGYGASPTANVSRVGIFQIVPDGTFDPFFGNNGVASFGVEVQSFSGQNSIVEQPDGKVVTLSTSALSTNQARVLRFSNNGTLDTGFGNQTLPDLKGGPAQLVMDTLGRFVVATNQDPTWMVHRLLPSGLPDPSFGDLGKVIRTSPAGTVLSISQDPDGRIVALIQLGAASPSGAAQLAVARLWN